MRALLSVFDKKGIVEFAKRLQNIGIEIISTGGTAKLLKENNINVTQISEITNHPEILGGRVKTLHPKIHGAILAKRNEEEHIKQLKENEIEPIDLVVVNLYPFEKTIQKENVEIDEVIENIDIGGPTLLRAAAKNFKHTAVVCDPSDYDVVASELETNKKVSEETRKKLALKAFECTADYDAAIDTYLRKRLDDVSILRMKFEHGKKLRYGENWHQKASFFKQQNACPSSIAYAKQLHGKELSYNNLVDGDSALETVRELKDKTAVSIVKHNNPCGLATGETLKEALEAAWSGDTVSAFGSIIAFTKKVDLDAASYLKGKFVEAVIAPAYDDDALDFLKKKSKDLRILEIGSLDDDRENKIYKSINGGILEQDKNKALFDKWESITKEHFPDDKKELAKFTIVETKHTKSNAVILGIEYKKGCYKVLGMGAGQPNRVDSFRKLTITKAKENLMAWYEKEKPDTSMEDFIKQKLSECVLVSDAFFPFDDTVRIAAEENVKFIVQPGGSIRDNEVIKACDELGIAMVFTGMRHFTH